MAESMELKIESLCTTILRADSENWDVKNKAVLRLTEFIRSYENQPANILNETFNTNFFRLLKDPVKVLVMKKIFFSLILTF
jgi:hypothetical protein